MDALFNPLTPIEATFLRKLKFKWKSIFLKEEMSTSFNFSSYQIRTVLKSLIKKWFIIPFSKGKYLVEFWDSNSSLNNTLNILCWENWYIWWTRVANLYFWYEQVEQKYVVFNEKLSWRRIIWTKEFLFIRKKVTKDMFIMKNIKISNKEQSFIDLMNYPWFVWWDYEVLERAICSCDVNKIKKLIMKYQNKTVMIRFLYICYMNKIPISFEEIKRYKPKNYVSYNILWTRNEVKNPTFNLIF